MSVIRRIFAFISKFIKGLEKKAANPIYVNKDVKIVNNGENSGVINGISTGDIQVDNGKN